LVAKEEEPSMDDPLVRASDRHAFTDADAEIEHLSKEVFIFKTKALIVDDMKT